MKITPLFKNFFVTIGRFFTLFFNHLRPGLLGMVLGMGLGMYFYGYFFDNESSLPFSVSSAAFAGIQWVTAGMHQKYNFTWKTYVQPLGGLAEEQRFIIYWKLFGFMLLLTGAILSRDTSITGLGFFSDFELVALMVNLIFFVRNLILTVLYSFKKTEHDWFMFVFLSMVTGFMLFYLNYYRLWVNRFL
jgi:hypothetical protein